MEQLPSIPQPHHHRHFRLGLLVSVTVVALAVVSWLLWPIPKASAPTEEKKSVIATTISAPQEYTDFVGKVTAKNSIDRTLQVLYILPGQDGSKTEIDYTVTVTPQTIVQQQLTASTGVTEKALTFDRLQVNDRIHLYATKNLYLEHSFTPTKLYLISTK